MDNKERQPLCEPQSSIEDAAADGDTKQNVEAFQQPEPKMPQLVDETGRICKGTKIIGKVITKGHFVVCGEPDGNLAVVR